MELEGIWELGLLLKSPLVVEGAELPCSIMSRCLDYLKSCPEVVVGKEIEKVGRSIHFNIMNEANMGRQGPTPARHEPHGRFTSLSG